MDRCDDVSRRFHTCTQWTSFGSTSATKTGRTNAPARCTVPGMPTALPDEQPSHLSHDHSAPGDKPAPRQGFRTTPAPAATLANQKKRIYWPMMIVVIGALP